MKMLSSWGSSKTSRKGRRTVMKTKIRWELLGLQDPADQNAQSIEDIRRQVSSLASRGLGSGTRSRSKADNTTEPSEQSAGKRRRGATE